MKNMYAFFAKSILIAFACVMFAGCDDASLEIPYYQFSRITKYERDSIRTTMSYNDDNRLSEYGMYVNDSLTCKVNVRYTPSSIICVINDYVYNIQLSSTLGGSRAESILVTSLSGSRLQYIEYEYDGEGRLWRARLDGVDPWHPIYNHYRYEGDTIIIDDAGTEYRLELSTEENSGYVCNVLDYAEAPMTSQYVINPDLYFLNIYGAPIGKLPYGHVVTRCNNNKNLSRVGKYHYEY